MKEAYKDIKTGAITYAVRNTTISGLKIKKDQILIISENKIIGGVKNTEEAVLSYLEENLEEQGLVTLYYGDMVKENEAMKLKEKIEEKYKDVEVAVYDGKQPVYFYFISLE